MEGWRATQVTFSGRAGWQKEGIPRGEVGPKEKPVCRSPSQAAQGLPLDLSGLETRACKLPLTLNSLKWTHLRILRTKGQLREIGIFLSVSLRPLRSQSSLEIEDRIRGHNHDRGRVAFTVSHPPEPPKVHCPLLRKAKCSAL